MIGVSIKDSRGVGLIEVLVTLLLLSIALLTLTTLQSRSLQYNQGAYFRSQANIYAGDILDRMRSNVGPPPNFEAPTAYNIALAAYNLAGAPATGSISTVDVDQWRRAIAQNLPDGQGSINCDGTSKVCLITITWKELNGSGLSAEDNSTLIFRARL